MSHMNKRDEDAFRSLHLPPAMQDQMCFRSSAVKDKTQNLDSFLKSYSNVNLAEVTDSFSEESESDSESWSDAEDFGDRLNYNEAFAALFCDEYHDPHADDMFFNYDYDWM